MCVCVFGTNECLIQKWHQYPILTLGYWLPKMRLGSLSQPLAIRNSDFHHTVARRLKQKSHLMERKTHLINLFHACDLIDIPFIPRSRNSQEACYQPYCRCSLPSKKILKASKRESANDSWSAKRTSLWNVGHAKTHEDVWGNVQTSYATRCQALHLAHQSGTPLVWERKT